MATREINIPGGKIPVTVHEENGVHIIEIDGVKWAETANKTHAAVLFNMIADHITEYVQYERRDL